MNRELIVKATECKPCTVIGKNLKSEIPGKPFWPHMPCVEPNQEIQFDFGGAFFGEKGNEVFFIAARNHFSKYPTACIYEKANRPDVLNFLDMNIENRGIPRFIPLDQVTFEDTLPDDNWLNGYRSDIEVEYAVRVCRAS